MQTMVMQTMDAGPGNAGRAAGLQGQAAGQAPTLIDILEQFYTKIIQKFNLSANLTNDNSIWLEINF